MLFLSKRLILKYMMSLYLSFKKNKTCLHFHKIKYQTLTLHASLSCREQSFFHKKLICKIVVVWLLFVYFKMLKKCLLKNKNKILSYFLILIKRSKPYHPIQKSPYTSIQWRRLSTSILISSRNLNSMDSCT